MPRLLFTVSGNLFTIGTATAFVYFISPEILAMFGISERAVGLERYAFLLVMVLSVSIGAVAGWFLFPLALRPFVSNWQFWHWLNNERQFKVPILDDLHNRWCTFIFGRSLA